MKRLLFIIIILIPIICYAQSFDPNSSQGKDLGRKLEEIRRGQSKSSNSGQQKNINSSSSSVRGMATPNKVGGKNSYKRTSAQRNEKYKTDVDVFSRAANSNSIKEDAFNAFQNADRNKTQVRIGGKKSIQHAESLMRGDTPGDVTVNVPIEKRFIDKKAEIDESIKKRAKYNHDYSSQFRKIENILRNGDYQMSVDQITQVISSRAKGEKNKINYPKEIVVELDQAAKIYKVVEKQDQELRKLQSELAQIKKECGGKCK